MPAGVCVLHYQRRSLARSPKLGLALLPDARQDLQRGLAQAEGEAPARRYAVAIQAARAWGCCTRREPLLGRPSPHGSW